MEEMHCFVILMVLHLTSSNSIVPKLPANLDPQKIETSKNIINQVLITINFNNSNNSVIPIKLEDFQNNALKIYETEDSSNTTKRPPSTITTPRPTTTGRPNTTTSAKPTWQPTTPTTTGRPYPTWKTTTTGRPYPTWVPTTTGRPYPTWVPTTTGRPYPTWVPTTTGRPN